MKPPKDPFFYFRYGGLGLLMASIVTGSRIEAGIGVLLFAISFMKRIKR